MEEHRVARHGFPDPKIGVHTATQEHVAAGYAYMAWEADHKPHEGPHLDDYPVVVTLDVKGLRAEPDTDAVLWWFDKGGKENAREVVEMLEKRVPPHRIVDQMNEPGYGYGPSYVTVTAYFIEPAFHGETIDWENIIENARDALAAAVSGHHESLRRVLLAGFPQRRYMVDFDLDRVIAIETFRPWRDLLAPPSYEDLDPVSAEHEALGFEIVAEDEADSFTPTYRDLYRRAGATGDSEYHGTSGRAIVRAFPELDLPDPDEGWQRFWKAQ